MSVDDEDSVMVCGGQNSTVQVRTAAGKKHRTLLSDDDDISCTYCDTFRPKMNGVVGGGYENNKLFLYQISEKV